MSFLSIAFLAALPLAAAPILLHLFDRRRNVVIEWGAMQFLMEAATRRTSARRLKQWLLLSLRVLAIAALVLALARPRLPGGWFGTGDRGETVFVLDNSMSMLRRAEGDVPLFETARDRAATMLEDLEAGDAVRVLLASPYPVWMTGGSVRVDAVSRKTLADQLRELRPTHGRSDLLSALLTAVQAEVEPTRTERRIVLLTDGQGSDWNTADEAGWKRLREALQTAAVPTRLDVVSLDRQAETVGNLAVNEVRSSRMVVGVHQSFTLTAQVQNHSRTAAPPSTATWRVGTAEQYASHVPPLDGGQVHEVAWKHSFAETGVYALSCEIDARDALAPDNRATVVVEVVEEVPILLVESAPELAEMQRDAFFVEAALGWSDGEPLGERGVHVPTIAEPAALGRMDLEKYRAVVVPNLTALAPDAVAQLAEFVSGGGGLWLALGPRTDVDAFNAQFYADGSGLSPLAIDRIVEDEPATEGDGRAPQTQIDPQVPAHPATAELADGQRLDTGEITVSRRFRFVPPPQADDVSVLLSLTDGQPLAVEKYVGRGRVIVQSVPLRLQWSELARSQAFVVLVRDWLAYLTQPRATRHNLSPGDPISVHLADAATRDALLRTPQGDDIELAADAAGDGVVFRSRRTILPGDYVLELGPAGGSLPFHVRRDPQESHLAPLTAAERELLAGLLGLGGSPQGSLSGTTQADPLWPLLLMIVIALIAAELVLSGAIARERFGSDAIAETTDPLMETPRETTLLARSASKGSGNSPSRAHRASQSHALLPSKDY